LTAALAVPRTLLIEFTAGF